MKDDSISNFGLLIAYILPGLVALWGGSQLIPSLSSWILPTTAEAPTVGGFLYTTVAAIGAGLTASTVRWLVIDPLHHATGIARPQFDFSRFAERVEAYHVLNENHYRYYQFYANTLMAGLFAYFTWRCRRSLVDEPLGWPEFACALLAAVFFAASRDTLRRFYARLSSVLGEGARPIILLSV